MKDDTLYLSHIIQATDHIIGYASEGEQNFFHDIKTQDAVLRKLEIIGEAVKRLSPELKERHPDIPWRLVHLDGLSENQQRGAGGLSLRRRGSSGLAVYRRVKVSP